MEDIKKDFPVLTNNPSLIYLDTCASSLKPKCVIDKLNEYYEKYGVNVNRGVYNLSYMATVEYEETRKVTLLDFTLNNLLNINWGSIINLVKLDELGKDIVVTV